MKGPAELHLQRGNVLEQAGDFAGALAAYDLALQTAPHVAAIHYGRGNALAMLRDLNRAIGAYDSCLASDPGHLGALYNRAMALIQLQRWREALIALDALIGKAPGMADAWNNRAGVLQALGRKEEALESINQVLALRPRDARAFYNAGALLMTLNRFDEAEAALERALAINPAQGEVYGLLVSAALKACDWPAIERLLPRLLAGTRDGSVLAPPLALLALSDDPALQLRCAELSTRRNLADTELSGANPPSLAAAPYRHDKIRIGYLSSDFCDHPVAAQIVGLLERHDRAQFEVIGLSTGPDDNSALHRRIVGACDRFLPLGTMPSREAANRIRENEIDILVDLNGHTMGWRPAILKYRPAPVVATFLGYAGTTGADFVDYIIGDPHVTPFALSAAMSEKIVQLPASFWPSDSSRPLPEVMRRAEAGLPDQAFVFCCFNSLHKVRPQIFDVWARLLKAVPNSVLWLRDTSAALNARFRQELRQRGLDEDRLVFAGRTDSLARHLGRQALADLFLDTFPYNAHATAGDALWAGLPVVTLRGESFVSRICAGMLTNAGLEELVASSIADYEALALSLARDPARLRDIRLRLAAARTASPLFDMTGFVKGFEAALRGMQARAQRGEAPAAFRAEL